MDKNNKLTPYIASSWKTTPDSVTFTIRPNVTCGDGHELTASDVKKSFKRMIALKSPLNTSRFGRGPYELSADDKARTFTFKVGTPFRDLVYGFVDSAPGVWTGIICPEGLANPSKMETSSFGAGPYQITEAVHGDHLTMKLRKDFTWGPAGTTSKTPGVPETIVFKVVENDTTAANLLLTGGLDVAAIGGSDVDRLSRQGSLLHRSAAPYMMEFLALNQSPGRPGEGEVVRKALYTALDPAAFLKVAHNDRGVLSSSPITSEGQCYDPATKGLAPKPSTDAARQILLNAGWTMSGGKLVKDGKPLTVHLDAGPLFGNGPEYITSTWRQMGVNAVLDSKDVNGWVADLSSNNFDAFIATSADPLPLMKQIGVTVSGDGPPSGSNYAHINNPVVNREVPLAMAASTAAQACEHWKLVQEQLWKHWDILPLSAASNTIFTRNVDLSLLAPSQLALNPGQPPAILMRRQQ